MCWGWASRFQEMGMGAKQGLNREALGRRDRVEVLWGIAEMYRIWDALSSSSYGRDHGLETGAGYKYPTALCLSSWVIGSETVKRKSFFFFFFFPHGWITVLAIRQGWPCTCVHSSLFNQASWKSYFSWTFVSIKLRLMVHLFETILVSGKTE